MSDKKNKKNADARKNAEAQKAKKKLQRTTNSGSAGESKPGTKGKSIVGQSKKK